MKRNEIRLFFTFAASFILLLSITGDFLLEKTWTIGPLQYLAFGLGSGFLISSFFVSQLERLSGKRKFVLVSVILLIDITLSLIVLQSDFRLWIALIILGAFAGIAAAYLIYRSLVCLKITRNQMLEFTLFCFVIFPFLFLLITRYLQLDFWYDEVYSLKNFILVSPLRTVTDYPVPNNHIFFNLILNLVFKVIGQQNINVLADFPWMLRSIPLLFSLLAILFLYLAVKKKTNRLIAFFTLIIFTTTIPYYNFAVQIRGYGLSITLVCALLFFLWQYETKINKFAACCIIILSALTLYTIPTNAYFMAGLGFYYAMYTILQIRQQHKSKTAAGSGSFFTQGNIRWLTNIREFNIACLMLAGAFLAFILYLPVLDQLSMIPLIDHTALFPVRVFYPKMFDTLLDLLYKRYLLLLMAVTGLVMVTIGNRAARYIQKRQTTPAQPSRSVDDALPALQQKYQQPEKTSFFVDRHPAQKELNRLLIFSIIAIIFPFIASFLHAYDPYDRVFLIITPAIAFFLAIMIYHFFFMAPEFKAKPILFFITLLVYCSTMFISGLNERDMRLLSDIRSEKTSQDIIDNYYQAYYHPSRVIKDFAQKDRQEYTPVWINQWGDTQALPLYAAKYIDPYLILDTPEAIASNSRQQLYVITIFPNKFIDRIQSMYPDLSCASLNRYPDYTSILYCECIPGSYHSRSCPPVLEEYK